MPKTVAYGVSAWSRGAREGHLDGIGVYTRALYDAMQRSSTDITLTPYAFGESVANMPCGDVQQLAPRVSVHLAKAALFKHTLHCDAALFHATDHYIPRLNIPVVATVMDLIPFLHPEWVSTGFRSLKNWLFKKSILSADHLITISEQSRQDLIHHFGIDAAKITVTPLGVDACYFDVIPEEKRSETLQRYGLQQDFFLFIGTLQPRKNVAHLLDAHAMLPLELQRRHPMVIVGRNGWGVDELLPRLRSLEASGTVRWLDYVPQNDVIALLQSAAALTFMSLYEGFGLPIIEAFASNCPVIASNTTSIPEVAHDAAILLDPNDAVALSEAMQRVLEDRDLIATLKKDGQARARMFTWDACREATLLAYQRALG